MASDESDPDPGAARERQEEGGPPPGMELKIEKEGRMEPPDPGRKLEKAGRGYGSGVSIPRKEKNVVRSRDAGGDLRISAFGDEDQPRARIEKTECRKERRHLQKGSPSGELGNHEGVVSRFPKDGAKGGPARGSGWNGRKKDCPVWRLS